MRTNVIDDIFGTEEEVRNIVRRNLPDYLTKSSEQPRLYVIIADSKTNQELVYILKPSTQKENHRGIEAIKTFHLNPENHSKINEAYTQLDLNKQYRNCA